MGIAVYPVYALLKRRQTPERRKGGDVFDSYVRHRPPLAPNFNVEAKAVHQAPKKEEKKKRFPIFYSAYRLHRHCNRGVRGATAVG